MVSKHVAFTPGNKWGQAPFILTVFHHTAIAKQGTRQSRAARDHDPGELRRSREERMENSVKNLKGARLFAKTFSNNGNGNAYTYIFFFILFLFYNKIGLDVMEESSGNNRIKRVCFSELLEELPSFHSGGKKL